MKLQSKKRLSLFLCRKNNRELSCFDISSLKNTSLRLSHINLLDNEAEGMIDEERSVIAVQYHPESAAGPEDSEYVFTRFTEAMKKFGGKKNA